MDVKGGAQSDSDDDASGEDELSEELTPDEKAAREQGAVASQIVQTASQPILIDPKTSQLRRDVQVEAELEKLYVGEAYIDIVSDKPPKGWGGFNNRHIKQAHVNALERAFHDMGIAFWQHEIAVVVDPPWVKSETLSGKDTPAKELKPVEWTKAVNGQVVQILGGNHRRAALKQFRETLDKQIRLLNRRIKPEVLDNPKTTEKAAAKMRARIQRRDDLVARRDTARYWRAVFYTRSE